ncbi:MAG: M42 family metallopeptidase, partial [Clostridiales bacterium]|nr:M42 family metallopeptidase [Clostridiales bacterium]
MLDILMKLCAAPGISGHEEQVRQTIIEQIEGFAPYEIDGMGNLIVHKKGDARPARRLMLAAHMDEVGFLVTHVEESGLLRFVPVGGVSAAAMFGSRVLVGEERLPGVIGGCPIHLLKKDEQDKLPKQENLYIDIGADSASAAKSVVSPGDPVVFDSGFELFGDGLIKARALDDRAGVLLLIQMIRGELPFDMDFVFTVQEEVGLRGAKCAAYHVNPDCAIVVDSTTAADLPGVDASKQVCALKGGAAVSFMDGRTVYDPQLYRFALDTARRIGVKAQPKAAATGGNDAGAIHLNGSGVPTLALSMPCRYLHSPSC